MAEQQSRLAIVIDSTGAQRNAEGLAGALTKMTQAGQKAADTAGKTAKATEQEAKSLSDLLDRIDPVNAALNRLDDQQRQLAKFQAKGFIDTDTFSEYSKKIEDARGRLTGFADTAGKAGISSKQAAYQMRMIPAQMTDIAVSLAGGQSPFMVLLQQGGQLKDMFGGIGPATKAVGTYVARLINPFTLAAGAVGLLGLAYHQGSEEQDEFNKSLILTGNLVGQTSGQLGSMASRVSAVTGATTGAAASVLNQLISAGKVASGELERVTAAIVQTSKATGIATDELVGDFNKIAADPVAAISSLNDKYHFLTLSTYNQVKALQEEGNQQDAARVASEAYSSAMQKRSDDIKASLGSLETAWNSLTGSASKAWDAMLGVGREQTIQDKLATLNENIADAQKRQAEGGIWNRLVANSNGTNLQDMIRQRDELQAQVSTESTLTGIISSHDLAEQKLLKTQQEADRSGQQLMSNSERRAKAIDKENSFLKAGAITAEEYSRRVSRINDMYKDPQQPKGKSYTEDSGSRMLDQLRQQQQVLMSQADTGEKIGAQQQALIKWEQQLADIKSKQTLTADQKSLLTSADLITSQLQQNAVLERQIETREKLLALDKARADITRTITNRQNQYATDELFAGGGLSQNEQQQYTQRLSLEQSYNDKITQLRQSRAQATSDIAREEIDQEIQLQQQALQTELSNYDAHMQRMNDLRGNFTAGAKRAWQEYQDSAANVSAMSQQLFSNAISGMEDALVKFVTTGKASFSDFANSVLADIARIAIRQSLVGIGDSFAGGFGGLFSKGASAGQSFAVPSFRPNAKGGVYDSPSLSAYSGGVYDSPKFFAFAKGAGVFGEAGPEAIMPLKRGPDGSLGVRMVDGGQSGSARSGDVIIHQTIQVSGSGDAALERAMEEAARKGATDGAKQARQDMLQDFQNRGQGRRLLGV
ncbi:phage tail tape measure protein [Pantoea sp. AG702]|uniref:phage tail tape measure protein n=1 Tax=Pantoea sp. AG702 TaxID=2183907 RepID=UPI000D70EF04|nr:phage tail tape measure protein [Pantoea sp. AG702]PWW10400.1 lambda family phage tail tape measure protein [Pantoea sp. AG702]